MNHIADISEVLLELGLSSSVTDEERAIALVSLSKAEGAIRRHLRYDPTLDERIEYYPQQDFGSIGRGVIWESEGDQAILKNIVEASSSNLQLRHIPIRSSPAIDLRIDYDGRSGTKSGAFDSTTIKVEGTDFWPNYDAVDSSGYRICKDGILKSMGLWPDTAGTVRIVYTGGYSSAELHGQDSVLDASSIVEAVIDEAVRRFKKVWVNKKQTLAGFTAGPMIREDLGDYSYTIDASLAAKLFGSSWEVSAETVSKLEQFVNYGCLLGV